MNWNDFPRLGTEAAQWTADYHQTLRDRPVMACVRPGQIKNQLPEGAPEHSEEMQKILDDFEEIIMPGMTHWQHPRFFAYFPANISPPSMLAEILTAALGAQCMLWQTSPAATELEEMMVRWLAKAMALPEKFGGVIQDSASSASLAAVLTMRERAHGYTTNAGGLMGTRPIRIYCSDQVHSSIDKACRIAGLGQENLVKITTEGALNGISIPRLRGAILEDREMGYVPAGIIGVTGATSIGASDDLEAISEIAEEEGLYTHLDAAWAGTAMVCPEYRENFWKGAERFDSIVFNPHKWLGTHFDCSVQFLRNMEHQCKALSVVPDYLKNTESSVSNFSDWSIPLGRRFRSLKLWFVIRAYGLEGIRNRLRNHVIWADEVCGMLKRHPEISIVTNPVLSLFSFRVMGDDQRQINFVKEVNESGDLYLTSSVFRGKNIIRFQVGQFDTNWGDVLAAYVAIVRRL